MRKIEKKSFWFLSATSTLQVEALPYTVHIWFLDEYLKNGKKSVAKQHVKLVLYKFFFSGKFRL